MDWNYYLAGYAKTHNGTFFGTDRDPYDCHLILSEGERTPILVFVDSDPAGKYSNQNIFARTCVQLNGTYRLKLGPMNAAVGGVKGLAGMLGGGNDYGFPEVTRSRIITTDNKPFTKQVLGDLDFRNILLKRKRDHVRIQPTPQGDGWHLVEVGDIGFEAVLGSSPWTDGPVVTYRDAEFMTSEDRAVVKKAAQDYFNAQMDEFLTLLRAAARAVTAWRM